MRPCNVFLCFVLVQLTAAVIDLHSMADYKKEVLGSQRPVVLFVYSQFCRRCDIMQKDVVYAEELYPHLTFARVDADEVMGMVREVMAISLPTFAYYENGKKLRKRSGPMTGMGLKKFIEQ